MGTHVVALCGEVFPVTRSAKPGSPVCPDCKRIYENLKKGLAGRVGRRLRASCLAVAVVAISKPGL